MGVGIVAIAVASRVRHMILAVVFRLLGVGCMMMKMMLRTTSAKSHTEKHDNRLKQRKRAHFLYSVIRPDRGSLREQSS